MTQVFNPWWIVWNEINDNNTLETLEEEYFHIIGGIDAFAFGEGLTGIGFFSTISK